MKFGGVTVRFSKMGWISPPRRSRRPKSPHLLGLSEAFIYFQQTLHKTEKIQSSLWVKMPLAVVPMGWGMFIGGWVFEYFKLFSIVVQNAEKRQNVSKNVGVPDRADHMSVSFLSIFELPIWKFSEKSWFWTLFPHTLFIFDNCFVYEIVKNVPVALNPYWSRVRVSYPV